MFQAPYLGFNQQSAYNLRRKPLVDFSSESNNRATIVTPDLDVDKGKSNGRGRKMGRQSRKSPGRPRKSPGRPRRRRVGRPPKGRRPRQQAGQPKVTRKRSAKKRVRVNRGRLIMKVPGYGVQRIPAISVLRQVPIGMIRKVARRIANQANLVVRSRKKVRKPKGRKKPKGQKRRYRQQKKNI